MVCVCVCVCVCLCVCVYVSVNLCIIRLRLRFKMFLTVTYYYQRIKQNMFFSIEYQCLNMAADIPGISQPVHLRLLFSIKRNKISRKRALDGCLLGNCI